MKSLSLLLLFIGSLMLVAGLTEQRVKQKKNKKARCEYTGNN